MNLVIKGKQEFLGKEIPVVEGGFGENNRCLTDKTIAEIHGVEVKHIRECINKNICRFKESIDIVNLKIAVGLVDYNILDSLGYSKMQISKSNNIYLLSERGYAKLIKIMDSDLAWEIHDKLIEEYFAMRQVINSNEQLKANLLLAMYNGGAEAISAAKQLSDIEVQEATKPLIETIEEKETIIDRVISDDKLFGLDLVGKMLKPYSKELGARNIFKYMRNKGILMDDEGTHRHNIPYDKYNTYFELKQVDKETMFGYNTYTKCYFNGKGFKWFLTKLVKDGVLTNSQKETVINKI